jgi:hypothetical protein
MYHNLVMWNTVFRGKDTVLYLPFGCNLAALHSISFLCYWGKVLHLFLLEVSSESLHEIKRLHATVSRSL